MPRISTAVERIGHLVSFHRDMMNDWVDRLLNLDVSVTESENIEVGGQSPETTNLPIVTVNKPDLEQPWFTSTETRQSFHHALIDKEGRSSDLLIEVFHQFCREDYYSVVSRVLAVHEAGEQSGANTHLRLTTESLEKVITPNSLVIIASINDKPIAFTLMNEVPNDPNKASEILIEVVPHKRNSGIATALFYATLQHPETLPSHIEAIFETMNVPVLNLLNKAQKEGYIRYTLKIQGPDAQANIEIVQPEDAAVAND